MADQRRLRRPETSISHSSVLVSASLLLSALLGAAQGLLLVFIVGPGSDTDAFLAAYSLYIVFAIVGGSLRASIVPVLGAHDSERSFRDRCREVLARSFLLGLVLTAALAAISTPAGLLLTLGLPAHARWTAVFTLLVLSPAASMQVYAAAQAAVLVSARRFAVSASLYVLSGALALGASAVLLELLGVIGAAVGLLIGGLALALGHGAYLGRLGVRPRLARSMLGDKAQRELAGVLLAAASISVALQLNLSIALATLSSDAGAITSYSYAFFIVGLALAISSFPLVLTTIPDLVQDHTQRGIAAAREYLVRVPPYAFAVLAPALVAFAADGKPLLHAIFADSLSSHGINLVYEVGLILGLMAIPSTLVSMAATVTQALGRARLFLPLSIASVAIQATLTIPLSSISPVAVAGGHAATLSLTAMILYRMVFGPGWSSIVLEALQRSAPAFALAAVFVLVRLPFGSHPGAGLAVVAGAIGLVIYVALAILLWPAVAGAFLDLVRRPSYLRSAPRAAGR